MNMPKVQSAHAPTIIIALVVVFAVIGLYHVTLGRKRGR